MEVKAERDGESAVMGVGVSGRGRGRGEGQTLAKETRKEHSGQAETSWERAFSSEYLR